MAERFAIYFTLEATDPIYQLASIWLGYDTWNGKMIDRSTSFLANENHAQYSTHTTIPSWYGFHATLKPPFRLKPGISLDELDKALKDFSQQNKAFNCKPLTIQSQGQFLTLKPEKPCEKLNILAEQCVKYFDKFRAPLNEAEISKRVPEKLTERQRKYLELWGYPFVCDEFQFHMTLSNKLHDIELQEVSEFLKNIFSTILGNPLVINQIFLSYQADIDQRFKIIKKYSFRDSFVLVGCELKIR